MSRFHRDIRTFASLLACAVALQAQAATIVWTGNIDGQWGRAANWQGGSVPGSTDIVSFADVANQSIDLAANRTIAGMNFAAPDDYLIQDTGHTLTVGGTAAFDGTGAVTFDAALTLASAGVLFSGSASSGLVTVNGRIAGSGSLTFSGGSYVLTNGNSTFSGGVTVQSGAVLTLAPPANQNVDVAHNSNSLLGKSTAPVTIDGGTVRLVATGTGLIGSGAAERTFAFGNSGGLLELVGKTTPSNNEIWSFQTTAAAAVIPVVRYGAPASATNGWAVGGNSLHVGDAKKNSANGLLGAGSIRFDLASDGQGALVELRNTDHFSGTLILRGVPGGDSAAPNDAMNVARISLVNDALYAFHWTFENAVQVSNVPTDGTNRVLAGNITLAAGADVAFSGRPGGNGTLALGGVNAANETLVIHAGAAANFDVGYRTDATSFAGVLLNMKTSLEPGGTLRFRHSNTAATGRNPMQLSGNVIGKGNATADARFDVQIDVGTGNGQLNMAAGASFVVDGSGTGGLRVEGTGTRLAALLTPARLQQRVGGSGGTFTIAPSGTLTVSHAPLAANNPVKLGIGTSGTGGTVVLGTAANDLANWAGLVIKPSSGTGATVVSLGANQSFTSDAGITTTLDVLGGTLDVGSRTLAVEGLATLHTGTIAGSTGHVAAGGYEVRHGHIGARLSGDAALLKSTSGTVSLGGANDYSGMTEVQAGVLQILAGGTLGSGGVHVAGGATLAVDGAINGPVTVEGSLLGGGTIQAPVNLFSGGILAPGSTLGRLRVGGLAAAPGSTLRFDLAGTTPITGHDLLEVTGVLSLGGTLELQLLPGAAFAVGDKITLIDNDASEAIAGFFAGLPQGAWIGTTAAVFQISYTADAASGVFVGAGNDVMLIAIPEPRVFGQIGIGVAMLALLQRRRGRYRF